MRIVLGMSGASGAAFGVEFLKRCPAEEKFVILTRWGRNNLKSETGLIPEDLAPFAKKVYANEDLSAPFASGSNGFDATRVVLLGTYPIKENILFNTEIEFEHGGIAKDADDKLDGAIEVEQLFVDFKINDYINWRSFGVDIVPVTT